ncbi:MAG: phenylacetic acid degradation protein PaaN [Planctomycetota bacterium]
MTKLFDKHRETLERAQQAIRERTYWSPYPEIPSGKIYGETAKKDGYAAFESRLNSAFEIDQPSVGRTSKSEASPYGRQLGINYPKSDLDTLMPAMVKAMDGWKRASVEARVGVCMEILDRLCQNSFEMANAIMHTTGQSFMMSFQAGGPHALDRALEAITYGYEEMTRCPRQVTWEKRVGKDETARLQKTYRIVPRGVAVLIGCSTFPTWNGYPGLFASLVTGNAVAIKPHHGAVLPLALTTKVARDVLRENDFDPNIVSLVANGVDGESVSKSLVMRKEVGIVDYTGGNAFGDWLESNCPHAVVFTEKAGVNAVVMDSVDNLKAVTGNLAFSLCLYSGQMCTAPQNIFIPRDGIRAGDDKISFDEAAKAVVGAVNWLLSEPKRAVEILGAVQNSATVERMATAAGAGGEVLSASEPVAHEQFPEASIHTPVIIKVDASREDLYMQEAFGPIIYIVETDNSEHSIELAARGAREHGAITSMIYSTDDAILAAGQDALTDAGVPVSCNLTGQIFVNQAAAFSDFHVSGANPAGNATLCDGAFVSNRFRIVHTRVPVS